MDENNYRNIPEDQRTDDGSRGMVAEDVPVPPAASEGIAAVMGEPYPFLRGDGREKTWAECSPEERVERLRHQLRTKEMALQDLRAQVEQLFRHTHGTNGELLVPLYAHSLGQCAPAGWKPFDPLA